MNDKKCELLRSQAAVNGICFFTGESFKQVTHPKYLWVIRLVEQDGRDHQTRQGQKPLQNATHVLETHRLQRGLETSDL